MSILFVNTIKPNSGDTVTVSGSLTTTGKLTIGDASTDTVAFEAEISSSLIPDVGATYALGTMANSWGSLHVHGLGHIHTASINVVSSSLIPGTFPNSQLGLYDLGSSTKKWKGIFVDSISCSQQISCSNIGVKHSVVSDLKPSTDGTLSLGTLAGVDGAFISKRWKHIYALSLHALNITSSGHISSTGTIIGNIGTFNDLGHITASGNISASGTIISNVITPTTITNVSTTHVTASGNISSSGTITANAININKTTAASQDLNTSTEYSVNGSKVEVRAITAAQINDGTFASFKLLNTSIASDSVVLGSFTGGTAGVITGSILTAATTAARTASIQIHNETGGAIAADTPFTASFVVL